MILIGVFGGSGSGKSTVTNLLKQKLSNSISINIDKYMRQYMIEHKEELISKMNYKIEDNFWTTYFFNDYNEIKKWVSIIEHDLQTALEKIISENENIVDALIFDWMFLPLIPLWDKCNFSICVKCDENTKIDRLVKRLEQDNRLDRWKHNLINRTRSTSLDQFGHSATYTIYNNGTLDDLESNVNSILDTYKNAIPLF